MSPDGGAGWGAAAVTKPYRRKPPNYVCQADFIPHSNGDSLPLLRRKASHEVLLSMLASKLNGGDLPRLGMMAGQNLLLHSACRRAMLTSADALLLRSIDRKSRGTRGRHSLRLLWRSLCCSTIAAGLERQDSRFDYSLIEVHRVEPKRQTRRKAGTQSHGSKSLVEATMAGLPKEHLINFDVGTLASRGRIPGGPVGPSTRRNCWIPTRWFALTGN